MVRRLVAMVAVLFAISVLTFMIFNVIPAGDPAQRMAGHSSSPATVAAIRKTWGFDQPVYVQYERMMSRVLTGKLVSYTTEQNVDKEIFHDIGRTLSLAIGAALLWMIFSLGLGLFTAVRAGKFADRFLTEANWQIAERLQDFAATRGHSLLELAFSWLACRPQVASVIAGATKPEQLEQNAKAASWVLTPAEMAEVDRITKSA